MPLIAKPIVKNQLWVITDGVTKVGNVEADPAGYNVRIGDNSAHFSDTKSIEEIIKLEFERPKTIKLSTTPSYANWPTTGRTYNNFYDVKRKLHVYTKSKESKCYYAAGWFNITIGDATETQLCPKYIFIQRYPYSGPFHTREEADKYCYD